MPDSQNRFNEIYKSISKLIIAQSDLASSSFGHSTILGDAAEETFRSLMRSIFSPTYAISQGQIVNSNGDISNQIDVIVHENITGSIIGDNFNGSKLVRKDHVRCVIEVKKSVNRNTIAGIQSYSHDIKQFFMSGQDIQPIKTWAIAFRSTKSSSQILNELNRNVTLNHGLNGFCVLDIPFLVGEARQLKRSYHDSSLSEGENLKKFVNEFRTAINPRVFMIDRDFRYHVRENLLSEALLYFCAKIQSSVVYQEHTGTTELLIDLIEDW